MQRKFRIRGILLLLFTLITTIYLVYNKSFFLLVTFWLLLIYVIFSLAVMKNWRKKELFGQRSSIMLIIILFFLIIYGLRLFTIQFILKFKYIDLMNKQLISVNKEVGQRGAIYDSNGKKLAFNKRLYTISINPSLLNDEKIHDDILKDITVIKDSGIISLSENIEEELLEMAKENVKYKRIARNIDDEQKKEIVDLIANIEREKVKGRAKYRSVLVFERSIDRKYYKSEEYEKLVGMVKETEDTNDEKLGISGLEKQYQNYLVERKRDITKLYGLNKKNTLALSKETLFSDLNGKNIHLTIDTDLNFILNDEMKTQFKNVNAYEAYGLIMDPNSGKILAVAAFSKDKELLRNNIFQSQYEPGSIFKPLIVAAAMNEGFITPNTQFNIGDGRIVKSKKTIRESSRSTRGVITTREVVMKSSNVGMVLISDYFTDSLFEEYLKNFGLYDKTGVDFPNELKPYTLPYEEWDGLKKNNMAFGQGIAITPIQMITAFSAVVNGGTLYKPYLVEKITDGEGIVIRRNTPTVVRKVLSEKVSESMRSILADTVDKGTGKRARIEGYLVGGKTGTAQLSGGKSGYIRNEYLSSFIGFFPADKPKYIIMAMFMRPQAEIQSNRFGGVVAAPVVGNVIRRIIKEEEGFAKDIEKINVNKEAEEAQKSSLEAVNYEDVMPDLEGMSPQEVLTIFKETDIDIEVVGTGLVVEQKPAAGDSLKDVKKVKIILK
ncbi:MAG: penicillin-binding protein [Fusobacterium sp.]|uniref:penicillin-binding protein n=1 Tax=unclassified Fusobacterium TaxID=2648384 RepID=UPI00054FAB3C|nr:penicillin-binding protein [Fusobacterium sp. oral taxon 370]